MSNKTKGLLAGIGVTTVAVAVLAIVNHVIGNKELDEDFEDDDWDEDFEDDEDAMVGIHEDIVKGQHKAEITGIVVSKSKCERDIDINGIVVKGKSYTLTIATEDIVEVELPCNHIDYNNYSKGDLLSAEFTLDGDNVKEIKYTKMGC